MPVRSHVYLDDVPDRSNNIVNNVATFYSALLIALGTVHKHTEDTILSVRNALAATIQRHKQSLHQEFQTTQFDGSMLSWWHAVRRWDEAFLTEVCGGVKQTPDRDFIPQLQHLTAKAIQSTALPLETVNNILQQQSSIRIRA